MLALDACGITNFHPGHGGLVVAVPAGIDSVSGIGLIPRARDYAQFVALSGRSPELETDSPAWVIAVSGWVNAVMSQSFQNATCIVLDGKWDTANWYGGDTLQGSVLVTAPPAEAPVLPLPSLAP
jgi:hypothetical protein